MCVKTIVRTKPMRFAMRTEINDEIAESVPVAKNTKPSAVIERSNRRKIHNAKIDCTAKPPPKESRLNSAASLKIMRRESPRADFVPVGFVCDVLDIRR